MWRAGVEGASGVFSVSSAKLGCNRDRTRTPRSGRWVTRHQITGLRIPSLTDREVSPVGSLFVPH